MNLANRFESSFLVKILRNTFSAVGLRILMAVISLLLMPFMVTMLGKQQYGIFALLGPVAGYIGLLDIGFSSAFIKYISEYYTRKDLEGINKIINSGLGFYFIWTLLIISLSFLFLHIFLNFFTIPDEFMGVAIFAFWTTIASLCINNLFLVFGGVISGLQRIELYSFWIGIAVIFRACAIVLVLLIGFGLKGIVTIELLNALLIACINFFLSKKLLPTIKINFSRYFDWKVLKKLFRFGYKLQISGISNIVFNNIDKTLIGRFCGLEFVTFYHIGGRMMDRVRAIPQMFFSALLPGFSEIDAIGKREFVIETYQKALKFLCLIFLPVLLLIISAASSILQFWMGPGFEKSAYVIQVLGFGYCIFLFLNLGFTLSTAIENVSIVMWISIFQSAANIAISLIFVYWYGFKGVVFGSLIAITLSFGLFEIILIRQLNIKFRDFLRRGLVCALFSNMCAFTLTIFLGKFLKHSWGFVTRIDGFAIMIVQFFCFFVVFLLVLKILKPISKGEIASLPDRVNLLKSMLEHFAR